MMDMLILRAASLYLLVLSCVSCGLVVPHNYYYEYGDPREKTDNGEFFMGLDPDARLGKDRGWTVEIWGGGGESYYFNVQYYASGKNLVESGKITNIRISSIKTDKVLYSINEISDTHNDSRRRRMLGFGEELPAIPYHDLAIEFEYIIYSKKSTVWDKGVIKVRIMRNYYRDSRRRGVGIL